MADLPLTIDTLEYIMADIPIGLDKDRNPEYYSIIDRFNNIVGQWNDLNDQVHILRVPKIKIWKARKELLKIRKDAELLQSEYSKWNKEAFDFMVNPLYFIPSSKQQDIVFIHYSSILNSLIHRLSFDMQLLTTNFNLKYLELDSQRNFILAISSLVLSLLSIALSIILVS